MWYNMVRQTRNPDESEASSNDGDNTHTQMPKNEPLGKDPDGTTDVAHPEAERVEGMDAEDVSEASSNDGDNEETQ